MTGRITPDLEKGLEATDEEFTVPKASAPPSKDDRISYPIPEFENQSTSNENPNNLQIIPQSPSKENTGRMVPLSVRESRRKPEDLPVPNDVAIGSQRVTKRRWKTLIRKSEPMTQIRYSHGKVRVSELPQGSRKRIPESVATRLSSGLEQRMRSEDHVEAGQEENEQEGTQDKRKGDEDMGKGDDRVTEEKQSEEGDVRVIEPRPYEDDGIRVRAIESRPYEDDGITVSVIESGPYEDDGIRVRVIESGPYEDDGITVRAIESRPYEDDGVRVIESWPAEGIRRVRLEDMLFEEEDFTIRREYDTGYREDIYSSVDEYYSGDEDEEQVSVRQDWLQETFLPGMKFHDRLAAAGLRHLFAKRSHRKGPSFDIALGTLQRMVVYQLQRKLVRVVKRMYVRQRVSDKLLRETQELLKQYSTSYQVPKRR
jgi:hypothetical protein